MEYTVIQSSSHPDFTHLALSLGINLMPFTRAMTLYVFQTGTVVIRPFPQGPWRKIMNITGMFNYNPDSEEGRKQRYIYESSLPSASGI